MGREPGLSTSESEPWHSCAQLIRPRHSQEEPKKTSRKPMAKTAKKTANAPDLFGAQSASARRATKDTRAKPAAAGDSGYTARDIEVLEGLEPVRRRPGMYIGGTDEKA